jgi:hypothetical protein
MGKRLSFGIALTTSLIVALLGGQIPGGQRPLDYHAMITVSIPLAIVWAILVANCVWRFGRRGLWAILGAPLALYWPVWMIFNRFPPCYYTHNCI